MNRRRCCPLPKMLSVDEDVAVPLLYPMVSLDLSDHLQELTSCNRSTLAYIVVLLSQLCQHCPNLPPHCCPNEDLSLWLFLPRGAAGDGVPGVHRWVHGAVYPGCVQVGAVYAGYGGGAVQGGYRMAGARLVSGWRKQAQFFQDGGSRHSSSGWREPQD